MDNWPQFSDAVVDYYFRKKIAFWYIQAAQQQVCFMMKDDEGELILSGVSDMRASTQAAYTVEDALTHEIVLQGEVAVSGDSSVEVARMAQPRRIIFIFFDGRLGRQRGATITCRSIHRSPSIGTSAV